MSFSMISSPAFCLPYSLYKTDMLLAFW